MIGRKIRQEAFFCKPLASVVAKRGVKHRILAISSHERDGTIGLRSFTETADCLDDFETTYFVIKKKRGG